MHIALKILASVAILLTPGALIVTVAFMYFRKAYNERRNEDQHSLGKDTEIDENSVD